MNSTQFVVLAERIPTVAYASGALEVLLFSVDAGMSTTASAFVEVVNESEAPEDPGAFFVGTVTLASVQIQSTTAAPSVLPAALS
ncbi:MAG TPA: hypothetical protein VFB62_28000, partial [Polyangiaceae bacterium]|nr:hypothetical protein [Polyangiaceae bacterium]